MNGAVEREAVAAAFGAVVNMSAAELERWLRTEPSRRVGLRKTGASESIGHASGKLNAAILRKRTDELAEEDLVQMRRTVGFVKRHLAQRPENSVTSRWRYSLMNWGHDPLKEGFE